ncbi:MAG: HNH endonuclease [Thermoproteota archaeon]|nr:HNH endonuclease [Thermoproteota archaeon]
MIFSYKTFLVFLSIHLLISLDWQAHAQNQYEFGHDHGCEDARITESSQQYIKQQEGDPSLYLREFIEGYVDGYNECFEAISESIDSGLPDLGILLPIEPSNKQSITEFQSTMDNSTVLGLLILFLAITIAFVIRFRGKKRKTKRRRGFSQSVQHKVLKKQNHQCAYCKKLLNVVDYDHKNQDRSDNRVSNCQALCPNCHAVKTRKEQCKR